MTWAMSTAASYFTLAPGAEVVDRFGTSVGEVDRVLIGPGTHFDGIIVRTRAGRRFVDAPEVREIEPDRVCLSISRPDVEYPGEPRMFGVLAARWAGRTEATEEDRQSLLDALKYAYVHDELTTDELAERVGLAYAARSLDELERVLPALDPPRLVKTPAEHRKHFRSAPFDPHRRYARPSGGGTTDGPFARAVYEMRGAYGLERDEELLEHVVLLLHPGLHPGVHDRVADLLVRAFHEQLHRRAPVVLGEGDDVEHVAGVRRRGALVHLGGDDPLLRLDLAELAVEGDAARSMT